MSICVGKTRQTAFETVGRGLLNDLVQAPLRMKKGACTEEDKRTDGETFVKVKVF